MTEIPEVNMDLLKMITENTNNDLVLFFVILSVILLPVLMILQRGNSQRHKQGTEREKLLIEVIEKNTEAMVGVKNVIEVLSVTMQDSFEEILNQAAVKN